MRLLWQAHGRHVAAWWSLLTLAGLMNIALWLWLYRYVSAADEAAQAFDIHVMLLLSAAYVFGCAFRSFLPRADVQRYCLFDTWLSSVVIGRSVATVAEVCFAAQWAIMLYRLGETADVALTCGVARVVVPLIVVAQACSWVGVLTTNTLANAIENSIWAITFALVAMGLAPLLAQFDGIVFLAIVMALAGIAVYVAFLVVVDVPMYLQRWRHMRATNGPVFGLVDGFRDAARRRIVTHDLAHWRAEMPWMSLYFTAAVWASLVLSLGYAHGEQLASYRSNASPRTTPAIEQPLLASDRLLPALPLRATPGETWAGP